MGPEQGMARAGLDPFAGLHKLNRFLTAGSLGADIDG